MAWSFFRRSRGESSDRSWWAQADAATADPTPEALTALRATIADPALAPDDADRQTEFLEGLERLAELRAQPALVDLPTQHRVIGTDRCHFIAPASLAGPAAVSGKLFLTNARAIFTGASVVSWPWHRVRSVVRQERDVVLLVSGAEDAFVVRCNTYADAFESVFVADTLRMAVRRDGGSV